MFQPLGQAVSRAWPLILLGWVIAILAAVFVAPDWSSVTQDGEFVFLPEDASSRAAEDLYRRAFPSSLEGDIKSGSSIQQNPLGSTVVIIVRRTDRPGGLTADDHRFLEEVLRPELEEIAVETGHGYFSYDGILETDPETEDVPVTRGVWTSSSQKIGRLLASEDGQATLLLMELKTEFLDRSNSLLIHRVEELVESVTHRDKWGEFNIAGLDLAISGSATVGRDMLVAEHESAAKTEWFTKALVILLLLLIYRAPLLAVIPLITVGLAVEMTIHLLRIMAQLGWVGLFNGIEVYVTVVVYGAGVDYCLFLIARYKEELEQGITIPDAIATAVQRVGVALATSAGTSICGIGMMSFADFGKFQQAGIAISFGLFVVLCASVTFTPSLLILCGRWAFWPDIRSETITPEADWTRGFSLLSHLQEQQWLEDLWKRIADSLLARPATVFIAVVLLCLPFAGIAVKYHDHLSYGLLSDLPQDDASVAGAKAIQRHFAAGTAGPTTILLHYPELNIPDGAAGSGEGENFAEALTTALSSQLDELEIADIRSQKDPLGMNAEKPRLGQGAAVFRSQAQRTYLSSEGELSGDVMRFDLLFKIDPFSRDSIDLISQAEQAIRDALPQAYAKLLAERKVDDLAFGPIDGEEDEALDSDEASAEKEFVPPDVEQIASSPEIVAHAEEMAAQTEVLSVGPTAGIRDLKTVTDSDQVRIYILVVFSVYLVLVALLRKPAICMYLIVSVVFSYLVTLGVTFAVFWMRDPANFAGLDWKVPIFLFTILIAMGEDYNILLMARVEEEQRTKPPVDGVIAALIKTGSIISSCGVIMAGTFSSLMAGTLLGMIELGFALAFGVLLDTFVVRPLLVPAYLVMLHSGRFGKLGPWLGAITDERVLIADDDPATQTQPGSETMS
ncbi:MAG: MMPL family transporter [Planctomycetaceae bacterium]|nr:MMPL family transporter [Planctomycetaceae bacterium]